jgi:hypothetical protein
MSRVLTLDLPDGVDHALQEAAARSGKTAEELAVEWIGSHLSHPPRGSAEALMMSFGAWSMTPEERARIERMIEEDRLLELAPQLTTDN